MSRLCWLVGLITSIMISHSMRVTTTTDTAVAAGKLLNTLSDMKASNIKQEKIYSFYWWEGKVASEEEIRLSFETSHELYDALAQISRAHNYDVPMIIVDSEDVGSHYWKGVYREVVSPKKVAEELVAARAVACAQVSGDDSLVIKTTAKAKLAVQTLANAVEWTPIVGNQPYLDWLDAETRNVRLLLDAAADGTAETGKVKETKSQKEL